MATVKTISGTAIASVKTVSGVAIASVKTVNGIDAVVPWVLTPSGLWIGDTPSFTLDTGTVTADASDVNIRTASSFIAASQDFDFQMLCGTWPATAGHGLIIGFSPNLTGTGAQAPGTTNPIMYAKNAAVADGWMNDNDAVDGAQAAGWMSELTIGISRRGDTFYGLIDNALDHTFTGDTGTDAGNLFIGAPGAGSGYSATVIRYRLGPNLPAIS
ncbi:MAG: hypothetical protein Q8P46_03705 [Hyphomicrobiales bacterium]|nr:hypothetical protein [Hyphomicrobiales bacterium]